MARVVVGMSGGVDSCVAAALLAASGHEVIGVSLQLYDHSHGGRAARCCSPEDFLDARRVAAALGFPYYVVNREEAFRRRVLDDFVQQYRQGRTPNPCVRCNAGVKFESLVRLARGLSASAVATGHYARLQDDPATGSRRLLRARDHAKDQSYFLFDLTPEQIRMAMFPLGEMTKQQVRAEAGRLGLATAGKRESQDVCFVEGGDYRDFLRRRTGAEATAQGDVVDARGRSLGRHRGLWRYTVGQRRGLGVSSSRRLYVVRLEAAANRVVLGGAEDLLCDALALSAVRLTGADD
ncbi:MAG: tRNA 2-thiouridine(34) synthase MnmA, partial [Planctomycetota bacterium]